MSNTAEASSVHSNLTHTVPLTKQTTWNELTKFSFGLFRWDAGVDAGLLVGIGQQAGKQIQPSGFPVTSKSLPHDSQSTHESSGPRGPTHTRTCHLSAKALSTEQHTEAKVVARILALPFPIKKQLNHKQFFTKQPLKHYFFLSFLFLLFISNAAFFASPCSGQNATYHQHH